MLVRIGLHANANVDLHVNVSLDLENHVVVDLHVHANVDLPISGPLTHKAFTPALASRIHQSQSLCLCRLCLCRLGLCRLRALAPAVGFAFHHD